MDGRAPDNASVRKPLGFPDLDVGGDAMEVQISILIEAAILLTITLALLRLIRR